MLGLPFSLSSIPSYHNNFARNRDESAYPSLWNGLVGAWVPALGMTGGTLRDVSGFGNHGTLTSMDPATDWVVGGNSRLPGYSLDLDGSNDHIIVLDSARLSSLTQLTLLIWVTLDSAPATDKGEPFIAKGDVTGNKEYRFRYINAAGVIRINSHISTNGSNELGGSITHTISLNTLHSIASTWDGVNIRIYEDGVQISTDMAAAGTMHDAGVNLAFGTYSDAPATHFLDGQIHAVYVSNRAWTESELMFEHNNPLAPFILLPGLVARAPVAAVFTGELHNPIFRPRYPELGRV